VLAEVGKGGPHRGSGGSRRLVGVSLGSGSGGQAAGSLELEGGTLRPVGLGDVSVKTETVSSARVEEVGKASSQWLPKGALGGPVAGGGGL
jgi:hypothetical protein